MVGECKRRQTGAFCFSYQFCANDKAFKGIEAIIMSMTPEERDNPEIINGSRRKRIADGSGTNVAEVNKLLKQFETTRKMMKTALTGNLAQKLRGFRR